VGVGDGVVVFMVVVVVLVVVVVIVVMVVSEQIHECEDFYYVITHGVNLQGYLTMYRERH